MALKAEISGTPYTAFAPAKINLALHVTGRRSDGYHDIDTLVMFADVGDTLTAEPEGRLALDVSGKFSGDVPTDRKNLVIAAAEVLRAETQIKSGARLSLVKNLPVGAGIGGGSSDAAAALTVLNRLWGTGLAMGELMDIGGRLGADIPMCLQGETLRAVGKGDRLSSWPGLPSVPMVIVWPARFVSTGSVFGAVAAFDNPPLPKRELSAIGTFSDLIELLANTRNDLTEAASTLEPSIGEALGAIHNCPGCLISRMSGSGSSCFGIFQTLSQAESAASTITRIRPDWWVCAATAGE